MTKQEILARAEEALKDVDFLVNRSFRDDKRIDQAIARANAWLALAMLADKS